MKEFPRRRIEPLSPQPGQFETVLGRARYRRHRRATAVLTVSVVFLAGVAGGLSLGRQSVQDFVRAAQDQLDQASPTPGTDSPSNSAAASPKHGKRHKADGKGAVVVPTQASRGMLALKGRAVGAAGQAAAGLYIYPGRPGYDRYVPTRYAVGRTAADGTFSLSCPGTPVLLSPWPVNAEAKSKARVATWGATFVGGATDPASAADAPCSRNGRVVDTVVQKGSAVAGTVDMPSACDDESLPLWVWLYNDRSLTVRLQDLHDGDSFRAGGLPPGQHTLGANGNRTKVTVGGGATLPYDVTFSCQPGSPPEPVETSTPPSIPTPSETLTPLPTGPTGPTTEPEPSASTPSSPGPTGTSGSSTATPTP